MPPPVDPEKRKTEISVAVAEVSASYDGHALFVPSPDVVGRAMGRSRGPLSQGSTDFKKKLEEATGLKVIHEGVVLGLPEGLSPPSPQADTLERMKASLDTIHPRERQRVLAWLSSVSMRQGKPQLEITESPEYYG